ncbi:MAG TPA: methyltransferase domain-containing protein [Ferruginibacter sp.]|nr:methyltransferase domain-containing protein [Ferruginibacter sp.]
MPTELNCRLCNAGLNKTASFELDNLPLGVQYFPDKENLINDKPVNLKIYCCDSCGFVQAFGNQVVYESDHSAATSISPGMVTHKTEQAETFISKYNLKGKKILEAGSGDGHFLEMLTNAGAELAVGIEPSIKSKESSAFKNVIVYSDYVKKTNILKEAPFDGFATFHVLEHIPDIHDFIAGISVNLKDGAVGFVEVPSSEAIEDELRFYDIINDHLNYFTLRTLRMAFEMHNFEILDSYRDWNGEHDVLIVKKRKPYDFSVLQNAKTTTIDNLLALLNKYPAKKTAIWGASMHALTLLSQFNTDKIKYIIDSAPYKQNKFTPVTQYLIVAPQAIEKDPVDLIVIIAPRFEEEIVENLKRNKKFTGQIAVLNRDKIILL